MNRRSRPWGIRAGLLALLMAWVLVLDGSSQAGSQPQTNDDPVLGARGCSPGKDYRSRKDAGIEVGYFSSSGTRTVDSTERDQIASDIVGSCFDEQSSKLETRIYELFHGLGYLSVRINNLTVKPLDQTTAAPTPVDVEVQITEGQKCPSYSEEEALFQFLVDHRSHSLDADPECVQRAFAWLSHDRAYTKKLVQLLDFERNDEHDDRLRSLSSRYPATGVLAFPSAVPYLVEAIKQSESELIRTNAAAAIHLIYQSCVQAAVTRMKNEEDKPGVTSEQKERLQTAAKYVSELYGGGGPCKSIHGEPTTEKEMQRELDKSDSHIVK